MSPLLRDRSTPRLNVNPLEDSKSEGQVAMVWAMYLPPTGGPYGPYGDYEGPVDIYGDGWHHRLLKYYLEQAPDAEKVKHSGGFRNIVYDKLLYERGYKPLEPESPVVTAIEDHEPPRFFQTRKGFKELSSIISLSNRVWAVDETVKRIVERLDPGIHQFYPIEIRMPKNSVYPVQYYLLVVGRWLDSLSPENSDRVSFGHYNPEINYFHIAGNKNSIMGLALREPVFGSARLWRERGLREELIFFSDTIAADLASAGLKLPKYYRLQNY